MERPVISVITAVYNGEKYLSQCIESVLNQTYEPLEYLLIDGGSSDGTLEIIKKYEDKIDFWISEKDKGIYEAWNKAIQQASGDWLCFIGSDDFFSKINSIETIVPSLIKANKKQIRYVYCKTNFISESRNELINVLGEPWEKCKFKLRKIMCIPHVGSFHHKSLFLDHGYFNEEFKVGGDYEFLLREFKDINNNALFIDDLPLVCMRSGGISASLDKLPLLISEVKKARKMNEINDFSAEIFFWYVRVKLYFWLEKMLGRKNSVSIVNFIRYLRGNQNMWS